MHEELPSLPIYKKVMVIDDNEIDLYIAERGIKSYCFAKEIVLLDSAIKALSYLLALENTPDELPEFIFLDIRMPEMDGFGFLSEYEKLPEIIRKKCIIMMLSSSLNNEDQERANANPFVHQFLNKPLNREKLSTITLSS